ncbi:MULTISPECIES: bifunctional riboflavin kinase/FAD synthetase [unclassified Luteococcus]|uniref:bifunctional riboflavin kinase/FAD synthetase n=1 Tax=unclassified Luteococcus TaxID=2639923 RepID=UPI00313AA1E6
MSKSVVVIGNFDGVHSGHVEVLRHAQSLAPDQQLVVVTFWPHPMQVLRPEKAPQLLTGLNDRIRLLKQAGAAEVRVVQFTRDVSTWSPDEFVARVIAPLDPSHVVVGENFRFGYRAQGTVEVLRQLGEGRFQVDAMPLVQVDGENTCSTLVRTALDAGDVELAAKHLGRMFRVQGVVVMGDQRGRDLGFPTANLPVPAGMAVPADGVYAGWLTRLDGEGHQPMPAAISVGSNPTFQGLERRVETYVLDRTDLELYGVEIAVDFVARLRGQITFTGIEGLIVQMNADVQRTREVLGLPAES